MHMIPNCSRNANSTGRAFCLKPCSYDHAVTVKVGALGNHIPYVDAHAKPDALIRGMLCIVLSYFHLYRNGTTHCSVYAVEQDEKGIAACLDDLATVLLDRRVDQVPPQRAQPLQCSGIIQADQATVANHIGVQHRDQLPPSRLRSLGQ